jgi:hypothetical protein
MIRSTWRQRVWFGLAVFIGVSVAMLVGPPYLRPLPMWAKLVIVVAGCLFIASVAVYTRRRARRVSSL